MKNNTQGPTTSFSPEVLKLFQQFKESNDPDERGELLLQLSRQYADGYDPTDSFFAEIFHSIVDEYHQAFLKYNQAGLRLGRVLTKVIEEHTDESTQIPVVDDSLPEMTSSMKTDVPN